VKRFDGWSHVLGRMLAVPGAPNIEGPYARSYTRQFVDHAGKKSDYLLVDTAPRELDLARQLANQGFVRESLFHLANITAFHRDSSQAFEAQRLMTELRPSSIFEQARGCCVVQAEARRAVALHAVDGPALEFVREYESAVRTTGGDALRHARRALALVRVPALPLASFDAMESTAMLDEDGVLAPSPTPMTRHASTVLFEIDAPNLYDAERNYKRRFLDFARRLLGPSPGLDRARVYFGLPPLRSSDEIVRYAAALSVSPIAAVSMLATSADPSLAYARALWLGAEPPEGLDGLYLRKLRANPYLRVEVPSMATDADELPISFLATPGKDVRFRFDRLPEPPTLESEMKPWLDRQMTADLPPVFEVTLPSAARRLPLREPGAFRVRAEANGLSLTFFAVRVDAKIRTLHFPAETLTFVTRADGSPFAGLSFSQAGMRLGATDDRGVLRGVVLPSVRPDHVSHPAVTHCAEHVQCCSGCDTCWHHHGETTPLLISGRGAFFRTIPMVDSAEVEKVRVPSREATLFVYTDRPAYRAGDPLRFRGILRVPRAKLNPSDASRWEALAEQPVTVSIERKDEAIFKRTYLTGEFGTFSGEAVLPLSAARAEYTLSVSCGGMHASAPFEVIDYRKLDYAIIFTRVDGGVQVKGGYVWGEPVPDSVLKAKVNDVDVPMQESVVAAAEGDVVRVAIVRGTEELASKTMKLRSAPSPKLQLDKPVRGKVEPPKPDATGRVPDAAPPPPPAMTASKAMYGEGDTIELEVKGPDGPALVVLGDLQAYDWRWVTIRGGKAVVSFPASGIYDPGVSAFAVFGDRVEQLSIAVRTKAMEVEIVPEKMAAKPGETVGVVVRARPKSAISIAAVDEAIFMVREDETAEMYPFFHGRRPAAMAAGAVTSVSYDAHQSQVEGKLSDRCFKTVLREGRAVSRRYGGRWGGRENFVARGGSSRATESACLWSLRGLGAFQQADGSFGSAALKTEFGTINEVGNTALPLLAWLGAGYSHLSRDAYGDPNNPGQTLDFGRIVKKALQYLLSRQESDGLIGARRGDWLLNHIVAALALSEAYGITASELLKQPAQKAIDLIVAAQSADGGWSAGGAGASETAATMMAVMALKSAELSELNFTQTTVQSAVRYFDAATDDQGVTSSNLGWEATASRLTVASGLLARIFLQKNKRDPKLAMTASHLLTAPPDAARPDYEGWYMAALGLFQYDGPSGTAWKSFNEPVKRALVPTQRKGLWTLDGTRADLVFNTSLATLTLEVYYRYTNVFGSNGAGGGRIEEALAPPMKVRIHFPDTVLWEPELVTDEKGEARLRVPMPDSITTVRLTARGITKETAVGEGVARIESRQPFFVNVKTPAFFIENDECEIRGEVFNYTGSDVTVTVKLSGDGFTAMGDLAEKVTVGAQPRTVIWRVRVGKPGAATFLVEAERDAIQKVVSILPANAPVTRSVRGRTIEIGPDEQPVDLVVRARPGKSPLARVLEALRYLNGYPHG